MLKSLDLTSHAKARERNAGFREETADICSLSLLRNPAPRGGGGGGAILPPLCNQKHFFPQFLGISPPYFWTLWLIPLYRFRSLRFQIGDYLGKRSFLIEDLHSWKERILSSIGRNIGFSRSILYEHCRSILCEHWCAIQRNLQLLVHS
ncbi:hypothetical protein PVAP13_9NG736131 [Panicum virgatum]|uniref:Uncharacterized protein n=1 Tax=Panicum virgatum TaxID=38727 RepID=A0A8T0N329_PANVG|nr:hypothetical protein PVAP13_9NG736131 [Panicum virgatum]